MVEVHGRHLRRAAYRGTTPAKGVTMRAWQTALNEVDRVRCRTADGVLADLDQRLEERVARYRDADDAEIARRLRELDEEWDIERVLIVNASTLAGLGVLGGTMRRQVLAFPLLVTGFLLQHGLQGWCPPLAIFRRRGIRTRREIDLERYSLKLLRGDFGSDVPATSSEVLDRAALR
jgi:hypothetical protein